MVWCVSGNFFLETTKQNINEPLIYNIVAYQHHTCPSGILRPRLSYLIIVYVYTYIWRVVTVSAVITVLVTIILGGRN